MADNMSEIMNPGSAVRDKDFPHAPQDWSRGAAETAAQADGVVLTDDHWQTVKALQAYFARNEKPNIRELHDVDAGGKRIDDSVKKLVHFGHLNLLQPEQWTILARFDIIFCRNVMIYFNNDSKKKMVASFHEKLEDGGFLLLGHAESLMNVSTAFTLRHFRHDMVYQKPRGPSGTPA